jgi:serine/threonine protein kinase
MSTFYGNKSWDKSCEYKTLEPRFTLYKDIKSKFPEKLCSSEWDSETSNIKIIQRIGSPSNEGEVFLLSIDGLKFAAKIMPIINEESRLKNENEINYATRASNLVLDGKSQFFPMVYGTSYCQNTKFSEGSTLANKCFLYSFKNQLLQKVPEKYMERTKRFLISDDLDREEIKQKTMRLGNLSIETIQDVEENCAIPSNILMSELAWGDFRMFIAKYGYQTSNMSFHSLMRMIFSAIRDLQTKLGLIHRDLHTGNILLRISSEEGCFLPLIHDFGMTANLPYPENVGKDWSDVAKILDESITEMERLGIEFVKYLKMADNKLKTMVSEGTFSLDLFILWWVSIQFSMMRSGSGF